MKEEKLLLNLKRKRRDALEKVINLYSGYVSTIVYGVMGDLMSREDREEVVADTFLALWNHAESLDEHQQSIRGYLAAIARNKAISKLRGQREIPLEIDEIILKIPPGTGLEESLIQKELEELLRQMVNEMESPDREIFIRFYYRYEKINEISERMGMNPSTVKTKLVRGRTKLKNMLYERGYDDEDSNFGAI